MKSQLQQLGACFDWKKEISTCSPQYYKWTQWIFLRLFHAGLAYQKEAEVNWDPVDQTVLANEQVDANGNSWRSGAKVEKRMMTQWFFRVSHFADQLDKELDNLNGWPENVRQMQKQWIGKSTGTRVRFYLKKEEEEIKEKETKEERGERERREEEEEGKDFVEVYTTSIETIFGVSFLGISPSSPLLSKMSLTSSNRQKLNHYLKTRPPTTSQKETPTTQTTNPITKEKKASLSLYEDTGVHTGRHAINPINGKEIPIFVTPYVFAEYGTGVVMGVPGHHERDLSFAVSNSVDFLSVLDGEEESQKLINSEEFNGLSVKEGRSKIVQSLQQKGNASLQTSYKLRDWLISRQRYWGTPIPIVYCPSCGVVPVGEEELPVELPSSSSLNQSGNPLEHMQEWVENGKCGKCGGKARRETDTMDTFVDSSWYYLRFPDFDKKDGPFTFNRSTFDVPDVYVGGVEHSILHLLYARFIMKALNLEELSQKNEPFQNLITQGMVLGKTFRHRETAKPLLPSSLSSVPKDLVIESYEKMSKSKLNGVDPEEIFEKYGVDTARLYILFKAPPEMGLMWDEAQIAGPYRWLFRVWGMVFGYGDKLKQLILEKESAPSPPSPSSSPPLSLPPLSLPPLSLSYPFSTPPTKEENRLLSEVNNAIKTVQNAFNGRPPNINTAVSALMKLSNAIQNSLEKDSLSLYHYLSLRCLTIMLAPMAPHISSELWSFLSTLSSPSPSPSSSPPSPSSSSSSSSLSSLKRGIVIEDCKWSGEKETDFVFNASWPQIDQILQNAEKSFEVEVVVAVNGKKRLVFNVSHDDFNNEELLKEQAISKLGVKENEIKRIVIPKGRGMVNFVLNERKER